MVNSPDDLQRAVGGHIEVLKAGDRLDLIVNEDGAHDALGSFNGVDIKGGDSGAEGRHRRAGGNRTADGVVTTDQTSSRAAAQAPGSSSSTAPLG
jgi:hypothetical protein